MTPEQRAAVDAVQAAQATATVSNRAMFWDCIEALATELDTAEIAIADARDALQELLKLVPKPA